MTADPARVLADLRELAELTSDPRGAQRVAWTETWARARELLRARLAELPERAGVEVDVDEAGNLWATLPGRDPRAVILGSHLDSVPNGGWLDGALGVLAGLEVLRGLAESGPPPFTVRLVDWADEEGARFGSSLLGSSAATGAVGPAELAGLRDRDGVALPDALRRYGVEVEAMARAGRRLEGALAFLELHIEQGPVLEARDLPLAAVTGTHGVERHAMRFGGRSGHAGTVPMELRRDALLAAARLAVEVRALARGLGGLGTVGRLDADPGIVTAVAGEATALVDLRHEEAGPLEAMHAATTQAAEAIAGEEGTTLASTPLFRVAPRAFEPRLVDLAAEVVGELQGDATRLPSGALHDAAAVAAAGVPTVMLFVRSRGGISHAPDEDSGEDDIALAVRALADLTQRVLDTSR